MRHLGLVWYAALWRQPVDHTGEDAREFAEKLVRRSAGHARKIVDRLGTEGLMKLIRRYRPVFSRSDSGIDDVAVTALLKALQQIAEAAQ
jgi:hypothetical protein